MSNLFGNNFRAKALIALATLMAWQVPNVADAGPLLDWLRRRCACRQPVQPVCATPQAVCQTTCMQTCYRTVVNYVPVTAYRTTWEAVPVTTYNQQTSVDPCTGCTVTCMRPCTTYTYRQKQVPYITHRPVYSQQAYQVPVTYTSQMPQTPIMPSMPTGCDSCGVPAISQQQLPYQVTPATIPGGLDTQGNYIVSPTTQSVLPADTQPQLNQRPIIIETNPSTTSGSSTRLNVESNQQVWPSDSNLRSIQMPSQNTPVNPPQLFDDGAKTAWIGEQSSPAVERFAYTPVRTASTQTYTFDGEILRESRQSQPSVNHGWRSLNE
ncbi:MAG TPA: hypothetical protein PKD64_13565 [Pirellulaceae bacterium]|nr:hypothetical protein [Pirellulaceae bacterium]HMO93213.1 hypothetical protein [Pirellulaceae bacterium]HMP70044.1 hypothetical protein [Pirellulaceae bacterium]